jgi:dTDP-4-dehydrorhamnose 3,5-epimerase
MNVMEAALSGVLILEPRLFDDARGFFLESYNRRIMAAAGITDPFVQDHHLRSAKNVLRGLHYQIRPPQEKLLRVIRGSVLSIAVDIRRSSPTFARWVSTELSAQNRRILWTAKGFAHGFVALTEDAEVLSKSTDYCAPEHERTIAWDDPDLAIDWQLQGAPHLSAKDREGVRLRDAEVFE